MQHRYANDEPKLAHSVAKRLTEDIVSNRFRAGQFLGHEALLTARYGVSRDTFREALRQVEWLGIARGVRGVKGGVYVQAPNEAAAVNILRDYFDFSRASFEDLINARQVLELQAIELAIPKIQDRDIARLRVLLGRHRPGNLDRSAFVLAVFDLYRYLLQIVDNPVLTVFLMPLLFVTVDRTDLGQLDDEVFVRNSDFAWNILEEMVTALVAADTAQAANAVSRFLAFNQSSVPPQIATLQSAATYPSWYDASSNKLAQSLVYRIYRDIRVEQRQVGERLGNESELMARYDVSRSVFREACRVMEVIGIVRVRKGRAGGLEVSTPQPDNARTAVVYYLNAIDVSFENIMAARSAIELSSVPLATQRLSSKDGEHLQGLLASQRQIIGTPDFAECSMRTQKTINHLCDNAILTLYYDALLDSIYLSGQGRSAIASLAEHAQPITDSQAAIVDAVIHGDAALARRRTLQHHALVEKFVGGL